MAEDEGIGGPEEAPDDGAGADEPQQAIGWRELPRVVNLKDFAQMVWGEAVQIASSLRLALESLTRLPFGPVLGLFGLFLIGIRSCLLVVVIFVFGSGILLITILRGLSKLTGRRPSDDQDDA